MVTRTHHATGETHLTLEGKDQRKVSPITAKREMGRKVKWESEGIVVAKKPLKDDGAKDPY
jgi:hypothetical protein